MFRKCESLKKLNIENFNIDKVTNMQQIFTDSGEYDNADINKVINGPNILLYVIIGTASVLVIILLIILILKKRKK